ncbi:MAG: transposase [Tenuifilaceae bacterium]
MKNSRSIPIEHGGYYHIYNRGNNGTTLFHTPDNYYHFLKLYDKYIEPIADTYAWCLMGNHFHLLIRIKEVCEVDINSLPVPVKVDNPVRVKNPDRVKLAIKQPYRYFSDLFNAYTQAINKQEKRSGSLFERPFHRIPINSDKYFQNLIIYIHQNPTHHGFTDDFRDYPWSSYGSIISDKSTKIKRNEVLSWFDDKKNFVFTHSKNVDTDMIDHIILE